MGFLHQYGMGGEPQDLRRAREEFLAAYKQGLTFAAFYLAQLLEQGLGGPQDLARAKELYLFAAANGISAADNVLKRLHIEGELGLTADQAYAKLFKGEADEAAAARLKQFFETPSTLAICQTAWLYAAGKSVKVDLPKALKLFQHGAQQDYYSCEEGMGFLAAYGFPGFPRNNVEADTFLRLSIRRSTPRPGLDVVKRGIAMVEGRMNDNEKVKVQSLLRDALQNGH